MTTCKASVSDDHAILFWHPVSVFKINLGYGMYTELVNVQSDDCKLYCWSSVYSHRNHQYGKMLIYSSVLLCFQRLVNNVTPG